jgi:hypothetical protein
MRPNQRTLVGGTNQTTYAGVAKTDTVSLPLDFALQRIFVDYDGTLTNSSASTLVEDSGQAILSEVRLDLTGDDGIETVFKLSGADIFIKNFFDYSTPSRRVVPTTTGVISFSLVIDFRLAKNNPDDASVSIPLYALSSADLIFTYVAVATGYGTLNTAFAVTGKITLFEFIPENKEEREAFLKVPILKQTVKELTLANATGDEERDRDLTVGNLIRRVILISKTNAGARSDIEINTYTLETAVLTFMKKLFWNASKSQDKIDYKLPIHDGDWHVTGATILDFARAPVDEIGNVLGFDTRGMKQGDLKLTFDKLVAQPKIRYIQESVI